MKTRTIQLSDEDQRRIDELKTIYDEATESHTIKRAIARALALEKEIIDIKAHTKTVLVIDAEGKELLEALSQSGHFDGYL